MPHTLPPHCCCLKLLKKRSLNFGPKMKEKKFRLSLTDGCNVLVIADVVPSCYFVREERLVLFWRTWWWSLIGCAMAVEEKKLVLKYETVMALEIYSATERRWPDLGWGNVSYFWALGVALLRNCWPFFWWTNYDSGLRGARHKTWVNVTTTCTVSPVHFIARAAPGAPVWTPQNEHFAEHCSPAWTKHRQLCTVSAAD